MSNLVPVEPAAAGPTREKWTLSSFTRRHRFGAYVTGAFVISWTGVLVVAWAAGFEFPTEESVLALLAAMVPGPPLSALGVTALADGREGLRSLGRRLGTWRMAGRWYAFLLVMPTVVLVVLFVMGWLVDDAPGPRFTMSFLLIGAAAGLFEELGWTGVATPALLRRHRPLTAGLILGGTWSLWHVLADAIANQEGATLGSFWFPRFATVFIVGLIAWRVVMTFVYSRTGSLLLGVLLHGVYTGSLGAFQPDSSDGYYVAWTGAMALVLCVVAAGCSTGDTPGSHRGPVSLEDSEAVVSEPRTVTVTVPSCNGDPVLDDLVEESDTVRLRIVTTETDPGDGCLDSLHVELHEPLGDRTLIDMTSGMQVEVGSQP